MATFNETGSARIAVLVRPHTACVRLALTTPLAVVMAIEAAGGRVSGRISCMADSSGNFRAYKRLMAGVDNGSATYTSMAGGFVLGQLSRSAAD